MYCYTIQFKISVVSSSVQMVVYYNLVQLSSVQGKTKISSVYLNSFRVQFRQINFYFSINFSSTV